MLKNKNIKNSKISNFLINTKNISCEKLIFRHNK